MLLADFQINPILFTRILERTETCHRAVLFLADRLLGVSAEGLVRFKTGVLISERGLDCQAALSLLNNLTQRSIESDYDISAKTLQRVNNRKNPQKGKRVILITKVLL